MDSLLKERSDVLSRQIISACIEVHKTLGPGLLESAYETCLAYELEMRKVSFERQKSLPVIYKGVRIDCDYRIDLLVDELVVVELKSVEQLEPIHKAQVMTYLKLTGLWLGLLINFNVPLLKDGIQRVVVG